MGMGMASAKKKGKKSNSSKGMGGSKPKAKRKESFDVAKAMIKAEKQYDRIMQESIKAMNSEEWDESEITTEYIIAARAKPGAVLPKALCDWVPVAQIVLTRPVLYNEDAEISKHYLQSAVSFYCRELNYSATLSAPAFKSIPRNLVEYSAEPMHSFVDNVYDTVVEGKASESFSEGEVKVDMTKSKAREILGLESDCTDLSVIKKSYKRKSMELHPDRFVSSDRTQEEIDASSNKFALVKMAYEALQSGVRGSQSWYESLGGKARTEFMQIELISRDKASELCNNAFKAAVAGVDPDLTMSFVTRNQAAAC